MRRALPPARLTWIALLVLGGLAVETLNGLGLASLIALPIVAALTDLGFQSVRFPHLRVPDAALATGAFVALILPPTAPAVAAGAVAFAAIGIKHAVRLRGRPIVNPAAAGIVLGAVAFGFAPAWWASVSTFGEYALFALAALLIVRTPGSWRLPVVFFLVFAPFSVAVRVAIGATLAPTVLLLSVLDPATLFFGLFMVPEPRTAPRNPALYPLYAAFVAFAAVLFPLFAPGLGPLLALLAVGLGTGVVGAVGRYRASSSSERRKRARAVARDSGPAPWSPGRRVGAGFIVLILVGVVAATAAPHAPMPSVALGLPPHSSGGGGSGGGGSNGSGGGGSGVTTASCTTDNKSIPSSTLGTLHKELGPSVILSYDASTALTVFYDPVNQVTVTETDLYEDYGFAEFNGDDYAVSGCSP